MGSLIPKATTFKRESSRESTLVEWREVMRIYKYWKLGLVIITFAILVSIVSFNIGQHVPIKPTITHHAEFFKITSDDYFVISNESTASIDINPWEYSPSIGDLNLSIKRIADILARIQSNIRDIEDRIDNLERLISP